MAHTPEKPTILIAAQNAEEGLQIVQKWKDEANLILATNSTQALKVIEERKLNGVILGSNYTPDPMDQIPTHENDLKVIPAIRRKQGNIALLFQSTGDFAIEEGIGGFMTQLAADINVPRSKPNILLVEKAEIYSVGIREALETKAEVTWAKTLDDAKKMLDEKRFDAVIVSDINEIREIRNGNKRIPLLYTSENPDQKYFDRALNRGANAYGNKGDLKTYEDFVKNVISRKYTNPSRGL